jgi:hypothetical protein
MSHRALWLFFLVQFVFLVALYRQFGMASMAVRAASGSHGPRLGMRPRPIRARSLTEVGLHLPPRTGRRHWVFFLSVGSHSSMRLLRTLSQSKGLPFEEHDVTYIVAGPTPETRRICGEYRVDASRVIPDPDAALFSRWSVFGRPFVVLLSPDGFVERTWAAGSIGEITALSNEVSAASRHAQQTMQGESP